ncbi:MAG TPA: hypothetical protein VMU02_10220 [bacterium]|nr:hypothetical protein [bacterium]
MARRTLVVVVVVVALAWGLAGRAAAGPLGVGIMVGEPTGLSAKLWTSNTTAMDLGAAWSFADEVAFHIHGDYLFHKPGPPEIEVGRILFYVGVGGRIKLEEDSNRVGVRMPLGVTYLFPQSHLDFFLEIVPVLDLAPATELRGNGGFGIRYYLGGRPHARKV